MINNANQSTFRSSLKAQRRPDHQLEEAQIQKAPSTRYPVYKPSGQPWLGEVPAHWEVQRLNHNTSLIDEIIENVILKVIAAENIESGTGRYLATNSEFQEEGSLGPKNGILFNKLRPYLRKAFLVQEPMRVVGELLVIRPDVSMVERYAAHLLASDSFIDTVDGSTFGSKMPRVSWKKDKDYVEAEAETLGGRFDAGTPRINDGSLLFLQHMLHKMQTRGSRIAVVFNGSPLFTGKAGSGESDIRRWIIESDYLEAIVALPQELFYNTGISTYIWLLTNRKPAARRGKVQLIDASELYERMPKSHGNKRRKISDAQVEEIASLYTAFAKTEDKRVKLFDNADFGYVEIRVERPELTPAGKPVRKRDGTLKPDTKRRDYERIPLKEDIDAYFEREVVPHVPHAWMDSDYMRIGYEINFTRYFYEYTPLRPVEEIVADIRKLEAETEGLLERVLDL